MELKYYYSIFASFLFFILGLVFLFFGLDSLFWHFLLDPELLPSKPISIGIILFGILITSSFFLNLLRGKNYVLEANLRGVKIYTGSVTGEFLYVFIEWANIYEVSVKKVKSAMMRGQGGHETSALVFRIKPGIVKWPNVMISKNRISFTKNDQCDEIVIDAWLNKNKVKIAKEIKGLVSRYDSEVVEQT